MSLPADRQRWRTTRAAALRALLCAVVAPLLLAVSAGSLAGCGAAQSHSVALPPIIFKVRTTASGRKVYVRDFALLLEDATAAFRDKRWAEAVELYDIIGEEYPDHEGLGALNFNAGLALMHLNRAKDAAVRFRDAIRHGAGSRDARDAAFLLAEALHRQGEFKRAAAVYRAMRVDPEVIRLIGGELGVLDGLEASARQGLNHKRGGEMQRADRAFRATQRLYDLHRELRPVAESHWVPRAYYERGEIYRTLFETIHFKLPVARMRRDLEDKANLFLKAQASYFRAVRLHHKKWSLAAGFRIGSLYAQLIDDIYAAEVPQGLDKLTTDTYRDELFKHTGHLAKRAVRIYEKNIALAKRLGTDGDWVDKSRLQLDRMKALLRQAERRKGEVQDPTQHKMKTAP